MMFRAATTLIFVALLSVAIAVCCIAGYVWLFSAVRGTVEDAARTAQEAALLSTRQAHAQTVHRVVRDSQTQRDKLSSYFVTDDTVVDFLGDIEALSVRTGVSLSVSSVTVGDPVDTDGAVVPLTLLLTTRGSMSDVFYTLALLEAYPKALFVRDMRFTQREDGTLWDARYDVVVMRITEPKQQ